MADDVKFFKSQYTGQQIEDAIEKVQGGQFLTEEDGNEKYVKLNGGGSVTGSISVSSDREEDKSAVELTNTGLKKIGDNARIGFSQIKDQAAIHTSNADLELQEGTVYISGENIQFSTPGDIKFAEDEAEKKPILKNVGDPVDPSDATTKEYVDKAVKSGGGFTKEEADKLYFPIEGGTIRGQNGTATITGEKVSVKSGVSSVEVEPLGIYISGFSNNTYATLFSSSFSLIRLGGNKLNLSVGADYATISGLTAPIQDSDAANKKYVDDVLKNAGDCESMTNEEIDAIMADL